MATLTPFSCRWPLGDVDAETFRFCGLLRTRGSYCDMHHRLAHAGASR